MIRKWFMMVVVMAAFLSVFALPEIQLVSDGSEGEYCGLGYGITVNVSTPSSGYTIKYSESGEEGTWVDDLKYVDVCTDKPIFYQVTAEGYETKVGSETVTITPKELTNDYIWLVLPPEDYVYDGTAKEPEVAAADGEPSIITDADWEVSFTDNVDAGTATATFTGKGNYFGECFEEFEILKAENAWTTEPAVAGWTYGEAPSAPVSAAKAGTATVTYSSGATPPTLPGDYTATFTVPESDNYNALTKTVSFKVLPAEIKCVADGSTGEYCGTGYGISVSVSTPASGYTVKYAESAEGPWLDELKYVDVCTARPVYYQVTAEGYATATGSATVTVTPKELTNDLIWLVLPPEDYVYDGSAKEPEVAAADGEPSIITDGDWEVSFTDNVDAGTATATFTGKGNYFGECFEEFEVLKADNAWTTEPSVADWTYGQPPSAPVSAAAVGTAAVTWSSGTVPTLPGSYTATFTVPESANYNELTATVPFTVRPATIQLVADGVEGEYCGAGYGISVSVSTPASGYTVKYAESAEGPWLDELKYVDVCTARPVYYQVTAEGYATATGSATVTVTPKELTNDLIWLVLPPEDYVYDGSAKEPEVAAADGEPSIITDGDWEVSFTDNVDAGTATATFTGKGNYFGECFEEFIINGMTFNGGEEPGTGEVPDGGASKFDLITMYDGEGHSLDIASIESAFGNLSGKAVKVVFGESDAPAEWLDEPPVCTNVCSTSIWYKVSALNFEDFIHEAKITVTNRPVTLVSGDGTWEYDHQSHSNAIVTVGGAGFVSGEGAQFGNFASITDEGEVANTFDYELVLNAGSVPDNYLIACSNGTLTVTAPRLASLSASLDWAYLKATGTYFGQLKVVCTNGLAAGISNLQFLFADRIGVDGKAYAQLWSTPGRAAVPLLVERDGISCRALSLDASQIAAEGTTVTFGVSDTAAATIPVAERTIELYVRKRVSPVTGNETAAEVENFVGYLAWTSNGEICSIPVTAGTAATGGLRGAARLMSVADLNSALAVGAYVSGDSNPYCRLVEFSVGDKTVRGKVEVGAGATSGRMGGNAVVTLLGTAALADDFVEQGEVAVDRADGTFEIAKPDGCRFFKVRLDVRTVVE